jgi:23S rRNA (pseudouridine1915-N3)-methyltransferase
MSHIMSYKKCEKSVHMKIIIISGGYFKKSPEFAIFHEYLKRMKTSVQLIELDDRHGEIDDKTLEKYLSLNGQFILLDEMGDDLSSVKFSNMIDNLQQNGIKNLYFIIGGANGVSETIKRKAIRKIRFGSMTWPHMLVRVMLMEQLYRAQQISIGHPYHKA